MKTIISPSVFIVRPEYSDSVIPFLRSLYKPNNKKIDIDFFGTTKVTEGALMTMNAQMEKAAIEKNNKFSISTVNINFYVNKMLQKSFSKSGKKNNIHYSASNVTAKDVKQSQEINPIVIDAVVTELKKIGLNEYYEGFAFFLTELIGNATEHGLYNKKINWWLLRYKDHPRKCMKFVFVDMGIGIIGSHKKARLPIKYWFKPQKQVLINAMSGDLKSSTKEANRGRGLQDIRRFVENEFISDFILITNKVSLQYKDGKFIYSSNKNFIGTYFSWSISRENYELWKQSNLTYVKTLAQ